MRFLPVCKAQIHATGGNPGLTWSVAPLDPTCGLPPLEHGEVLYVMDRAHHATDSEQPLLDALEDLIGQFASRSQDSLLDSMGIWALADAMRILAAAGRLEIITDDGGRRVLARGRHD